MTNAAPITLGPMPDANGYFGEYGGSFIPPNLSAAMADISKAYDEITKREDFQNELHSLFANYVGRPSPIFHAKRLSDKLGGAQIHLKREDLNHTGAHKINHCLGEALLAKFMNKKKVIAETGAGQHGVALATACALVGIPCEIHMGQVDIEKVRPATMVRLVIIDAPRRSTPTPPRSASSARPSSPSPAARRRSRRPSTTRSRSTSRTPRTTFTPLARLSGPTPSPGEWLRRPRIPSSLTPRRRMVRDFQSIVGKEAREQFQETHGKLPDIVAACVGGGSNAIGLFTAFLNDASVKIVGVEPSGKSLDVVGQHAATLTKGKPGVIHGMRCYVLEDSEGVPSAVHSIASGLDYPGIGPQHSYLKDAGRVTYETASDKETLDAFMELSHVEGIIPALESAHAVAWAIRTAPTLPKDTHILINLSGRGGEWGQAAGRSECGEARLKENDGVHPADTAQTRTPTTSPRSSTSNPLPLLALVLVWLFGVAQVVMLVAVWWRMRGAAVTAS